MLSCGGGGVVFLFPGRGDGVIFLLLVLNWSGFLFYDGVELKNEGFLRNEMLLNFSVLFFSVILFLFFVFFSFVNFVNIFVDEFLFSNLFLVMFFF